MSELRPGVLIRLERTQVSLGGITFAKGTIFRVVAADRSHVTVCHASIVEVRHCLERLGPGDVTVIESL